MTSKRIKKVFHEIYPIDITGLSKTQVASAVKEYKRQRNIEKQIKDRF